MGEAVKDLVLAVAQALYESDAVVQENSNGERYEATWGEVANKVRHARIRDAETAIGVIRHYEPPPPKPLHVGDVVVLKSGGPRMTVCDLHSYQEGFAKLVWFSGDEQRFEVLPIAAFSGD